MSGNAKVSSTKSVESLILRFRDGAIGQTAVDYAIALLFLRYLTERHAESAATFPADSASLQWVVPYGSSFEHVYASRGATNLASIVNLALRSIEESNKPALDGIFSGLVLGNESVLRMPSDDNRDLQLALEVAHSVTFGDKLQLPDDGADLSQVIDTLAFDINGTNALRTPMEVASLIVQLLRPFGGCSFHDPACGGGSILVEAARQAGIGSCDISGQELNVRNSVVARIKMIVTGQTKARIGLGDTLRAPVFAGRGHLEKFDLVACEPPLATQNWGHEEALEDQYGRFTRGVPPRSKAAWAFISHAIACTKVDGRAVVVVPPGALFHGGTEGQIREALIAENLLDAVVRLPANVRAHNTAVPVVMLVFDKKRATRAHRDSVLFVDASRDAVRTRHGKRLSKTHVSRAVEAYRDFQAGAFRSDKYERRYARVVRYEEVRAHEGSLNIDAYLNARREDSFNPVLVDRMRLLEAELSDNSRALAKCFKSLGLPVVGEPRRRRGSQ